MTRSAAKRITPKPQLNSYYRWEEPDSDITICLHPETVNRLQNDVLRGIDSSPRAGNEVGGILFGRCEPNAGRTLIVVDEFEPVPCEHLQGPLYTLSNDDSARFEAALAWGKTRREHQVVGYYRSHCRQGLFLSADDVGIIQRHFPGPDNLFLLIKALPNRACTAGFFFRKDGHIQSEFTDSEVPLIPMSLSLEDESLLVGEGGGEMRLDPPVPVAPAPGRRITMPSLGFARRGLSRRLTGGVVLTGIALAAIVAVVSHRDTRPPGGGSSAETPRAVRNAESAAPSAMRAASGKATQAAPAISNNPKAVDRQYQSGADTQAPSKTTQPTAAPAAEARVSVPAPVTLEPGVSPLVKAPVVVADPPVNTVPPPPAETTIVQPAPTASAQTAPVIPPRLPDNPAAVPSAPARLDASAPAPRIDTGTAAPPPAPVSRPSTAFIGPQVIHQVSPAVPRGVGPRLTTDVQVDVEVAVDAKGRATGARVASTKGAGAELLTIEALKAAQLFRFRPAQENGRNVASTMVLTFRFDRSPK